MVGIMARWKDIVGRLSKSDRNRAKYQAKKERGPVKAMFHITRNENVPNIEKSGLLTNPPGKVNENSADDPFGTLGVQGGGVWVTDRPTAFPVYGSTVGGKRGGSEARRDALTTLKLEVPKDRLAQMDAVFNPYGHNMHLTTADRKTLFQPFNAWTGDKVGTTALLEDIPPEWLKPIGYVEEHNITNPHTPVAEIRPDVDDLWNKNGLPKADRMAASMTTGHDTEGARLGTVDFNKSPARFVEDYLLHNRPITERLEQVPTTTNDPNLRRAKLERNQPWAPKASDYKRYQFDPVAHDWTTEFQPYLPYGKTRIDVVGDAEFPAGAISRGTGLVNVPVSDRVFNWKTYDEQLAKGESPAWAAHEAAPGVVLDWDNPVYHNLRGYGPKVIKPENGTSFTFPEGSVGRGNKGWYLTDWEGDALFNGNENLLEIRDIVKQNGPKMYADEFNNFSSPEYIKYIKDINHPTWQEIVRAVMRLRNDPFLD